MKALVLILSVFLSTTVSSQYLQVKLPPQTFGIEKGQDGMLDTWWKSQRNFINQPDGREVDRDGFEFRFSFGATQRSTHFVLASNFLGACIKRLKVIPAKGAPIYLTMEQTPYPQVVSLAVTGPGGVRVEIIDTYRSALPVYVDEMAFLTLTSEITAYNAKSLTDRKVLKKYVNEIEEKKIDLFSVFLPEGNRLVTFILNTGDEKLVDVLRSTDLFNNAKKGVIEGYVSSINKLAETFPQALPAAFEPVKARAGGEITSAQLNAWYEARENFLRGKLSESDYLAFLQTNSIPKRQDLPPVDAVNQVRSELRAKQSEGKLTSDQYVAENVKLITRGKRVEAIETMASTSTSAIISTDTLFKVRSMLSDERFRAYYTQLQEIISAKITGEFNTAITTSMFANDYSYVMALREQYDANKSIDYVFVSDHAGARSRDKYPFKFNGDYLFSFLDDATQYAIIQTMENKLRSVYTASTNSFSPTGSLFEKLKQVQREYSRFKPYYRLDAAKEQLVRYEKMFAGLVMDNRDLVTDTVSHIKQIVTLDKLRAALTLDNSLPASDERGKVRDNPALKSIYTVFDKRKAEIEELRYQEVLAMSMAKRKERLDFFYGREQKRKEAAVKDGYVYKNLYFWYAMGGYENQQLALEIFNGRFNNLPKKLPQDLVFEKLLCAYVVILSNRLPVSVLDGYRKFQFKQEVLVKETTTYWGFLLMDTDREYRTDYQLIYANPVIAGVYDKYTKYTSKNGYAEVYGPTIGIETDNVIGMMQLALQVSAGNWKDLNEALRYDAGAVSVARSVVDYFGLGSKGLNQFEENLYRYALGMPSLQEAGKVPMGTPSASDDVYPDPRMSQYFTSCLEGRVGDFGWYSDGGEPRDLFIWNSQAEFSIDQRSAGFCTCVSRKIEEFLPKEVAEQRVKGLGRNLDQFLAEIAANVKNHPNSKFYYEYHSCKGD